jgi:hypothetical protein
MVVALNIHITFGVTAITNGSMELGESNNAWKLITKKPASSVWYNYRHGDVISSKFKVVRLCSSANYAQKWITSQNKLKYLEQESRTLFSEGFR